MVRRVFKHLIILIAAAVLLIVLATLTWTRVTRPRLKGRGVLPGLQGPVVVLRDSLGVPDIQAAGRADAARALGYLHGQERFFQMDLQRRSAAGELSALLGPALLKTDRNVRRHRFRTRAEHVLAGLSDRERTLLLAYTAGVNHGLDDLTGAPLEYVALLQDPAPWRPVDTILCLHAMCLDLSYAPAIDERQRAAVRDLLPAGLARLLLPHANRWEAPLQEGVPPGVILPDSAEFDVRRWSFEGQSYEDFRRTFDFQDPPPHQDTAGSNNWAVAGHLTAHGGALLANDMHLGHILPNIWYRARLRWPGADVVGVTLPGTPAVVVGSNGRVAWGFTNSQGDWADLVLLETDPEDDDRYLTPDGWRSFDRRLEVIAVKGAEPDTLVFAETIWGPVWDQDALGRPYALRWTAHDTEAVNLKLLDLEAVNDVDEAIALAGRLGIPPENFVCADADGRIAWTIAGRIPRRVSGRPDWDGSLPVSWADGACRWDGYLDPSEQPRIVDPPEGRLWTANARVVSGADLTRVGHGGYALGARARQIRDALRSLDRPTERDMLAVQMDDRALFMGEWRDLALAVLELDDPPAGSGRAELRRILRDEWEGRALPTSASYHLARNFSFQCVDGLYEFLTRAVAAKVENFRASWLPYRHAVAWEVVHARPANLLPPWNRDWDHFLLAALDRTIEGALSQAPSLAQFTWSRHHQVQVAHPLVQVAPFLARWLAAEPRALPGDSFMPRVQGRTYGASERLVVSPGREAEGIFHMPGGQSGHPFSPFFLAGHEDWVEGRPSRLLPGAAVHRLVLEPEPRP